MNDRLEVRLVDAMLNAVDAKKQASRAL